MARRAACLFSATAVLLATAAFLPPRVSGAVGGSPHDLVSQAYDVKKEAALQAGSCPSCHMPLGKEESTFLKEVPPSLRSFDAAGLLCFSCHDGTTIVSANVDASTTAFHPLSHGYDLQEYRDQIPDDGSLPNTDKARMSCTTCHDPHNNTNRPFLRVALGDICVTCHELLANDGVGHDKERSRNHPILVDFAKSTKESVPIEMKPVFAVPFPLPYPLQEGKTATGVHWDLGGHLEEGAEGRTTCYTCHAIHGDEESSPLESLLSSDPVNKVANEFCEGCHQGVRGDNRSSPYQPNPGGTTTARTYHPVDDDEGNGSGRLLSVTEPEGWPLGEGIPKPLLCTTCHRAHGGRLDTQLLRTSGDDRPFCEECHGQFELAYHHPTGSDVMGPCLDRRPVSKGREAQGGLFCSDCHRAHNAGLGTDEEEEYLPLLHGKALAMDFCTSCHPEDDPTCEPTPEGMASHFMGDSTLQETYAKPNPPIRIEPWPESGLPSVYEGESGKAMGCLSCHSFKEGAIVSGDDGTARFLLARAGTGVEWKGESDAEEKGEDTYLCTGCHSANPATVGSGQTHPLMDADIEKLNTTPQPPVTVTPGGHLNCDTCHRSHGARSAGGYFILEEIRGDNTDPRAIHPTIDYDSLCKKCHDSY